MPSESDEVVIVHTCEGLFRMQCPHCKGRLTAERIVRRGLIDCPLCERAFRAITKKQLKEEKEEVKKRAFARANAKKRVQDLLASGVLPPDRLSIFGVSSAGKSVFLASLYHALWTGSTGVRARALRGDDHDHLLGDYALLASGSWIDATTLSRPLDLRISFEGISTTLSCADYPGEVFTNVFYRKRQDTPECVALLDQLHRSIGAILLIDPEQLIGGPTQQSRLDVEYTGIEIAERFASRGLLRNFIIVFTKRNQNLHVVREHGGLRQFLRQRLPRLAEVAPRVPLFHLSAIGTTLDGGYNRVPTVTHFDCAGVAAPLLELLSRIDREHLELLQAMDEEALAAAQLLEVDAAAARRYFETRGEAGT